MAPSCPRVIFLIDKSQFKDNNYRLQIHLSCLRILSYYAHNSVHQIAKSGVLWGYKFFNSSSQDLTYGCKRYPFLDFTTKCFDDFEKELYIIKDTTQTDTTKDFSTNLKRTLTDLLSDFHWERPELLSPSKKTSCNFDDVSNIVFLFCPAPVNSELNLYFGLNDSNTKSQLLEKFVTKSLHVKFVNELKIKLFWVDSKYEEHSKKLLDESLLKKSLLSINGKLLSLSALTSCWLKSKNESWDFIDIMNSQTFYHEMTNSFNAAKFSLCEYSFKVNEENNQCCEMFVCSTWNKICRSSNHGSCDIVFNGAVPKENLEPNSLSISDPFFYILNFSECEQDALFLIQSTIAQKQVMKIIWRNSCQLCSQEKEAEYIMIPCTLKFGTIVPFIKIEKEELKVAEDTQKSESDEIEDDPLALVLKSKISNWEFGTALVNCVDTWFLYNPHLGFKHSTRNIFRKLYKEQIFKAQRREEQSKELLTALRKSIKEKKKQEEDEEKEKKKKEGEKTKEKKKVIKRKRLKGVSWVRSRLQQYHLKQKLHSSNDSTETENAETKDDQVIELPKPLRVEEFSSQDDMEPYLQEEWNNMIERENIKHRVMERFVQTPIQFFSSIDEDSCQEMGINFLKKLFFKQLSVIRSETPKEQMSKHYLLQIHLQMECSTALQGHQSSDEQENLSDQIVSFMRALIFEESINFVRAHLKTHLVPYFIGRDKGLLLDIHEEMMFDIPSALESLQKERNKDESDYDECSSPQRSIQMPSSFGGMSETSSVCSQNQQSEKRTLRRIPSAIGDNSSHQRMISVASSNKTSSKQRSKSNRKSTNSSTNRPSSSQPNPPKTPTLKRRHSENSKNVVRQFIPETPEGKQRNDLMWKKQELSRRVSKVDNKMEPIEESPLKQLTSPVKIPSSLCRSNSFSVRSSPRRFYAVRRISSQIMNSDGVIKKPKNMKNILLSNFQSPNSKTENSCGKPEEEEMLSQQKTTRRNIFSARSHSATSEAISFDGMSSSLSPQRESASSPPQRVRACKRLRLSESEDVTASQSKSLLPSENTLDWLTDMEQNNEQQKTDNKARTPPVNFREAFDQLNTPEANARTPQATKRAYSVDHMEIKQSPTVIRAGNEKITVSPLLSATSIEMLESAPILSPMSKKEKKNKNRRTLAMD